MKIALVELGASHDECLYSQIQFLKAKPGLELTLICSEAIFKRINKYTEVDNWHIVSLRKGFLKQHSDYRALGKYIRTQKFQTLLFNTAQGSILKKFIPYLRRFKGKCFGILHDTKKIQKRGSQQRISKKLVGYFVLNDYLLEQIPSNFKKPVKSLYTIFFPKEELLDLEKPSNEIWVCVPGQVELKRRDYNSLLSAVQKLASNKQIKFILLGASEHSHGDGLHLKKQLKTLNLESSFVLWKDFVSKESFHTYMVLSDYVMPLIHGNHVSNTLYKHQITGAFNLAFAYKKPLLMEQNFAGMDDFKDNALFYTIENFQQFLAEIEIPKTELYYTKKKWNFEFQKNSFWDLITQPYKQQLLPKYPL